MGVPVNHASMVNVWRLGQPLTSVDVMKDSLELIVKQVWYQENIHGVIYYMSQS